MDLKIAAALWSLKRLCGSELPGIALDAIEEGLDSPALRLLAGEDNPTLSEAGPIFEKMMADLNVPIPSPPVAAALIARCYAREIVDGSLRPYDGSQAIYELSYDFPELDPSGIFSALTALFRDRYHLNYFGEEHCKKLIADIETDLIEEARKLLNKPMPE